MALDIARWSRRLARPFWGPQFTPVKQLIKYGLVGGLNTLVTIGAIFVLMKPLRCPYILANVIGYVLGLANSFVWNKKWVFRSGGTVRREIILFLIVWAACYLLQVCVLITAKELGRLHVDFAQILSMAVFSIANFLGNKYISFAQAKGGREP